MNNKEVSGFATPLALQISRHNGRRDEIMSVGLEVGIDGPRIACGPMLGSVTVGKHAAPLCTSLYSPETCESTGRGDLKELPIMNATDPGLS